MKKKLTEIVPNDILKLIPLELVPLIKSFLLHKKCANTACTSCYLSDEDRKRKGNKVRQYLSCTYLHFFPMTLQVSQANFVDSNLQQ